MEAASKPELHYLNIKDVLFDLSLELTTEFLLGTHTKSPDHADGTDQSIWLAKLTRELKTAFHWISRRERLKSFYWAIDGREFRAACKSARSMVDEKLTQLYNDAELRDTGADSYVAMEPLITQHVDSGIIRDQFLNLLLAGRDTSGALLCWVFYSLAREPRLVSTLRAELSSILGQDGRRRPTKVDLNKLVQLEQFITESMNRAILLPERSY